MAEDTETKEQKGTEKKSPKIEAAHKAPKVDEFRFKTGSFPQLIQMSQVFAQAEQLGALDYEKAYKRILAHIDKNIEKV